MFVNNATSFQSYMFVQTGTSITLTCANKFFLSNFSFAVSVPRAFCNFSSVPRAEKVWEPLVYGQVLGFGVQCLVLGFSLQFT